MPSHKKLANWYTRLGQHLESGVPLADALRLCDGMPATGREQIAQAVESGPSAENAIRNAPDWLPKNDRLFILAALETGHLPQTLHHLGERHARMGATLLKIVLGLIYPLGVFHVFALLLPILRMIDYQVGFLWDPGRYVTSVLFLLLPVWAGLGLVYFLARTQHPLLGRFLRCLPLLRNYSRMQATADLSHALGTFIHAGIPAPSAWRMSVRLTKRPEFAKAMKRLEPIFQAGADPADQMASMPCFPAEFRAYYKAGAGSGQLDSNMLQAGKHFQDKANLSMTLASIFYPSLLVLGVGAIVIATIFQVYGDYLGIFEQFEML